MFKKSAQFVSSKVLSKLGKQAVSGSAFTQARYKIDWQFFSDLCSITSQAYDSFSTPKWKGYRILAGDGSTLNLPASKQIRECFGLFTNSTKASLARIFLIYDVNTNFTLQARLGRMSTGESGLLNNCLSEIPSRPDDLLVLDRYFGNSYNVQRMICDERIFYIRMSAGISNFAKRVMTDSRMDFNTEWIPSKRSRKTQKIKTRFR